MQRFFHCDENGFADHLEISRQTAFHEAGHVAAIYLENQRKNLPLIHFEINIGKQDGLVKPLSAKVSGGRLISDLATVIHQDVSCHGDSSNIDSFQLVYEADIINFLAGPLAEAKYISIRDDEVFNVNLLTPQAVNRYGGNADMQEVMSYLEFFIPSPVQREAKLNALFAQAFRFVQQPSNWKSITDLAHYILHNAQENISCEHALEVLTAGVKK